MLMLCVQLSFLRKVGFAVGFACPRDAGAFNLDLAAQNTLHSMGVTPRVGGGAS